MTVSSMVPSTSSSGSKIASGVNVDIKKEKKEALIKLPLQNRISLFK